MRHEGRVRTVPAAEQEVGGRAGLPLTLFSACAEHVPELRLPLPVRDGRLLWLSHAPAAVRPPAPRPSQPGNVPAHLHACCSSGCGF